MEETLKKVPLHDIHVQLGAKIVPFAGYHMPLQYSSVIDEHKKVRNDVGIFDVSHMGEFIIEGPNALALIQKISSNDAAKLEIGAAQYSCMPNHEGGIVDDLIIYQLADEKYMLVVNASNIEKDWNWIQKHNEASVKMENISSSMALFAVQGPIALKVLQKITTENLEAIKYYHFKTATVGGVNNVIVSATGYTGAGGFELYVPHNNALKLWEAIFEAGKEENIQPIGLGARDTLRLEMGYCLYGNDINDGTSPLEAGLGWITKFNKSFINSEALLKQKEVGVSKKLVGFEMIDRGIPRKDYVITSINGAVIGQVTSGSQSPMLGKGIGLGYIATEFTIPETEIFIQIRNKNLKAIVKKLPLYKK